MASTEQSGYGAYQFRTVRQLIRSEAAKQQQFEFIQEHSIIRSQEDYGQIVRDALRQEEANEDRWRLISACM